MRILIVDDEALVRRSLRRLCENYGHEVREAEDGLKGLDLWREYNPELVFVDVLMPGLTGPNLLKEIGAERKAKVILMSAYSGEYDFKKAQALGADLFLPKPFDDIFAIWKLVEGLVNGR